jgi:hypothetical protein
VYNKNKVMKMEKRELTTLYKDLKKELEEIRRSL